MGQEIERKYRVTSDAWRRQAHKVRTLRQGYLSDLDASGGRSSVRVRIGGDQAHLNIKSATLGIERREYEYPLPLEDAQYMLDHLCMGSLIEKNRHYVRYEGLLWEVDEFFGDNAGLVVAEVELESVDQQPALPDWVGEEVSEDARYFNVMLVKHPYKDWA